MVNLYNRTIDTIESAIDSIPSWVIFVFFLAIPVVIFCRPYFFYILDDWTALKLMVENPFLKYLFSMEGEQLFPFFHLVYYGMIKIAGLNTSILIIINALLTGITSFMVFQFFRLHLRRFPALILSLIYLGASVHTSTIFHAFNVCYILSFGFFVGALLLTDRYLHRPSWLTLGGIGLGSLLAILSHNFSIMIISIIPLYGLLLGTKGARRDFWPLTALIGVLFLCFAAGYFACGGATGATSHNWGVFLALPGPAYYHYIFTGWILAPNHHLFQTELYFPLLFKLLLGPEFRFYGRFFIGVFFFLTAIGLIVLRGDNREKRLCLWILLANLLPFILVGLVRYQISFNQAFSPRYGVFTLMGVLLLFGLGWRIFTRNFSPRYPWTSLLALPLLALIIAGQASGIDKWQQEYKKMSAMTRACYECLPKGDDLEVEEARKLFCPENHSFLTKRQALEIRRFLEGR